MSDGVQEGSNTAFARDNDGQLLALGVKSLRLVRNPATELRLAATAGHNVRILDWNRRRVTEVFGNRSASI